MRRGAMSAKKNEVRWPVASAAAGHRHRANTGGSAARLPGRPQQAHAVHPLDRDHEVDGTKNRPPALSGGIHPAKSVQPFLAGKGRTIATKAGRLYLKIEQAQPIAQAPVTNELTSARLIEPPCAAPGRNSD